MREHHVKKVPAVVELVAGVLDRPPLLLLETEGRDRAELGKQAGDVKLIAGVGLEAVRVVRGQGADHR